MKSTHLIYVFVAIAVVAGVVHLFTNEAQAPTDEQDLIACTADAMECPDGSFVGRTGPDCEFVCPAVTNDLETNQMIQVAAPTIGTVINSPLQLTGQAIGPWYFEASLPVEVRNWQGNVIATSYVTAQGTWMTMGLVPFTGSVSFVSPYSPGDPVAMKQGSVVFKKDNPSGEPQNAGEIIIPIQFAP